MRREIEGGEPLEPLLRELSAREGSSCRDCGADICLHEVLMCHVLGFRSDPACLRCLARGLGHDRAELKARLLQLIDHRDCYRAAWDWASEREGPGAPGAACARDAPAAAVPSPAGPGPPSGPSYAAGPDPPAREEWDAGDLGCGDLVLELRTRLRRMAPGEVLRLTARDPGAPEDLPAWCGLTGHRLLRSRHPVYWIQRKDG